MLYWTSIQFCWIFFNGYAPKYGKSLNSSNASKNVKKISEKTENVIFYSNNYKQYSNLKNYIIYCDPPYYNSVNRYYKDRRSNILKFDNKEFIDWCITMSKNNIIFLSSYNVQKDFEKIQSFSYKLTGISPGKNNKNRIENLYIK